MGAFKLQNMTTTKSANALSKLSRKFVPPAIAALLLAGQSAFAADAAPPRERISADAGWRFIKGDAPDAGANLTDAVVARLDLATGNPFTTNAPAPRPDGNPGGDISFAQPGFDDSQWRLLNLPHDWGIEGPFQQSLPGGTGRLPWFGVAWYRKHLDIPAADTGRKIYLDVDGAMSYATVWLNGKFVGGWPYGYSSWRVDLTPYVNFGGENVVAIRLNNPSDSSRWYPGGGIYRNVWLVKTAPVHIAHWGVYVTTPEVSDKSAMVKIQVNVDNDSGSAASVTMKNEIFELNADGTRSKRAVASTVPHGATTMDVVPWLELSTGKTGALAASVEIPKPKLWSLDNPQRYVVVTSIQQNGKTVDSMETPFGIRTIQFTADNGFLLNGKRVHLNGVCDHADLGALGMAVNVSALERQIKILKSFGCNAIRTSHNMPAPELLDLCDRMGMLVMDESFDCWESGKTRNDYHLLFDAWHERDWRAELRRDRNHPSIILWSIGNEVGEQGRPNKFWIPAELTAIAHQEDPTRPTTSANSDYTAGFNGFNTNEDVFGYNYKPGDYGRFHAANPNQPIFGSETASCISSRGEYLFPVTQNKGGGLMRSVFQVSDYDLYAPGWATTPDDEFRGQERYPFVAGEFVWTGFDYLGEPTPYGNRNDPARSSYFGIVDLAGFPKDRFYLYQAHWRPDLPMAHILPHWNWPERAAQTVTNADGSVTNRPGLVTPVMVFTSGDSAELFLNGKSLGLKKKAQYEYRLRWDNVVYQPGTLKVVAYKNGRRWATDVVKTTGPAVKLTLKADRTTIADDGKDLSFITVTVADKDGLMVPRSNNHIKFAISGPGEIAATDNGDATSFESFQAPEHNAFNGLALVIVRAKAGTPGTIRLTATSDGLAPASIKIKGR
jgi:beta-galactosidase